jgi:hypothetical protein
MFRGKTASPYQSKQPIPVRGMKEKGPPRQDPANEKKWITPATPVQRMKEKGSSGGPESRNKTAIPFVYFCVTQCDAILKKTEPRPQGAGHEKKWPGV